MDEQIVWLRTAYTDDPDKPWGYWNGAESCSWDKDVTDRTIRFGRRKDAERAFIKVYVGHTGVAKAEVTGDGSLCLLKTPRSK